jgi:radical SAM enzyme (TIGR01210 family)
MPEPSDRALRLSLVQANRVIREGRPPHPTHTNVARREYVATTGPRRDRVHMFQFWFRTRGCSYDRAGQCSMCNYGIGPDVEPDRIVRALRRKLEDVPEGASVYLSPSGSLLDDIEVPPDLRDGLLRAVAERRPGMFAFETRPELFTPDKLAHVRDRIPTAQHIGQVGVESWNPEVRQLCHLKPTPQNAYLKASGMLREQGFASIANVTLGALALSQREAFQDAVDSVRGARAGGYTTQMVFPLSAKEGTLLGWAADRGMWQPPTLWMLIRVLRAAIDDTDALSDLSISWFDPDLNDIVRQRPDGCALCRDFVLETLQAFRADPRVASLEPALQWRGCDCPRRTDELLAEDPADPGWRARLEQTARVWQETHPLAQTRPTLNLQSI